jgi:hypothetical protein
MLPTLLAAMNADREAVSACQLTASERFNVSLRLYKSIKALTQLTAVGAGIFALHQGAPPLTTFAIIGIIVSGQEVMEFFWANSAAKDDTEN